jgi:hypothetical protein
MCCACEWGIRGFGQFKRTTNLDVFLCYGVFATVFKAAGQNSLTTLSGFVDLVVHVCFRSLIVARGWRSGGGFLSFSRVLSKRTQAHRQDCEQQNRDSSHIRSWVEEVWCK